MSIDVPAKNELNGFNLRVCHAVPANTPDNVSIAIICTTHPMTKASTFELYHIMRSANGEFPEYHTSGDNLEFVTAPSLAESLQVVTAVLTTLEQNGIPINQNPCCEPQLGNRGLYKAFGQHDDRGRFQEAVMWVLSLADGEHDLIAISRHADLPFALVREAADVLVQHELLHF